MKNPDQGSLLAYSGSRTQVEVLAGILAGFVAPGYGSLAKCPKAVREQALAAAEQALIEMEKVRPS